MSPRSTLTTFMSQGLAEPRSGMNMTCGGSLYENLVAAKASSDVPSEGGNRSTPIENHHFAQLDSDVRLTRDRLHTPALTSLSSERAPRESSGEKRA